jgi:serine phosphatase RsbU (regulator of sigma subunit)
LGVAVGDVSGKGLPGALYMAITSSVLETHAPFYNRVGALLDVVDRTLHPRMQARGMNTGLAYLLLDPQHSEAQVSNAGLISPVLLRPHEAVRYLEPNNIPLGVLTDGRHGESVLTLQPDDILLLVSDGIIEAKNETNELYGFERFERLVSSFQAGSAARSILEGLLADVQQFMGDTEQHDDMTMVVVRVL